MKNTTRFQIKRQERETNLSLVRRFTKRVKESGVLRAAKRARFKHRDLSKVKKKAATLRRIEKKQEHDKLFKLGKVSRDKPR